MKRFTLCLVTILVMSVCSTISAQDRGFATSIAWSPDGATIAVGSTTGVWFFDTEFNDVRHIDTRANDQKKTWPISLDWNSAGNMLAVGYPVVGDDGGDIQIIDVDTLAIITNIYLGAWEEQLWSQVVWHPTENLFAAGGFWSKAFVWDALTGEAVFSFEESNRQAAFPWNSTVAVCWLTESILVIVTQFETYVVSIELSETLQSFDFGTVSEVVDCHSDYRIIEGRGEIHNLRTGASIDLDPIEIDPTNSMFPYTPSWAPAVQDVEFSTDGNKVLRIEEGCRIFVFDSHTGKLLAEIPGGIYFVQEFHIGFFRDSLTWHPDSSRFAAVGQLGGIRIWDAETYKLLQSFDGFETSYPEIGELQLNNLSEEQLSRIDAFKMKCIEALNSER